MLAPSWRASSRETPREPRRQLAPAQHVATAFEAFYQQHQNHWREVAYLHTGQHDSAEEITDAVTGKLAENWEFVLQQENLYQYAWFVLGKQIELWLREHGLPSAFVQTAAFIRSARATCDFRGAFEVMEESLGLYSAIAKLPGRQFDVTVLRHILGYPDQRIAQLLGIPKSTVRSHHRYAHRALEVVAAERRLLHSTGTEG